MRAENEARDEEALAPLLRVASESGAGEVESAVGERGKARLLEALARRQEPRWGRRVAVLAMAAVVAVGAAGVFFAWPGARLGLTVEGGTITASGFVEPAAGPAGAPATLRFSDGSTLALGAGTRARVADVSAHGARLLLESGGAHARIVHARGTAWSIEAGPFTIAVTGTAFDVDWRAAEQALDVRMIEGTVIVRGPQAPGGVALHAGQRLVAGGAEASLRIGTAVAADAPERDAPPAPELAASSAAPSPRPAPAPGNDAPPPAVRVPSPPVSSAVPVVGATVEVAPSAVSTGAAPASSDGAPSAGPSPIAPLTWAQRVAAGDFAGVLAEAEARGIDAVIAGGSLADLGALADAGRYRGRTDLARRALGAERARFAGSREASNAAFLLGRIAEDAQGSPAAAVALYDQYLAESPGGAFAEEALGRRMVSLRRSAGVEAARGAAEAYLRRYPQGGYAAAARELSRAP